MENHEMKKLDTFTDPVLQKILKVQNDPSRHIECPKHGSRIKNQNGICIVCDEEKINEEEREKNFRDKQKKFHVPNFYIDCSFENFHTCAETIWFKNAMENYKLDSHLIITGKPGNGKTHLACAILNRAIKDGFEGMYATIQDINEWKLHDKERYKRVLECKLLVIDEYGAINSHYKQELLHEVVMKRDNNSYRKDRKFIILVSNIPLNEPTKEEKEENEKERIPNIIIKDVILSATRSRLADCLVMYTTDWEDYRRAKK